MEGVHAKMHVFPVCVARTCFRYMRLLLRSSPTHGPMSTSALHLHVIGNYGLTIYQVVLQKIPWPYLTKITSNN
jgi:hypothetical protein